MNGPASPNEVPFEVRTSIGRAVVSVVAVVVDRRSGGEVDRLVLRSAVVGHEDVYAVFERGGADRSWCKVTDDLTATQLQDWPGHRRQPAHPTPPFRQWLDRVMSAADREDR